jgi:hypothetical protein
VLVIYRAKLTILLSKDKFEFTVFKIYIPNARQSQEIPVSEVSMPSKRRCYNSIETYVKIAKLMRVVDYLTEYAPYKKFGK